MWASCNQFRASYSCVVTDSRLWNVTPYRLVSLLGPKSDISTIFRKVANYLHLTWRNIPEEMNHNFVTILWKIGLRHCQRWAVRVGLQFQNLLYVANIPSLRSVLGDRWRPPANPWMIIFVGWLALNCDPYSELTLRVFSKSGFCCVCLRRTEQSFRLGIETVTAV